MTAAEPLGPAAEGGGGAWRLDLRVEPADGEPFAARARAVLPDGQRPAVGASVEVLHGPRPRRWFNWTAGRRPIEPLLLGAPPTRGPGEPEAPERAAARDEAPSLGEVLGALARGLEDGSLAAGLPVVVSGEAPVGAPAPALDDYRALGLEELALRAAPDPEGVAAEAARRLRAGEADVGDLLRAAGRAGVAPGDVRAVIAALRGRGG